MKKKASLTSLSKLLMRSMTLTMMSAIAPHKTQWQGVLAQNASDGDKKGQSL